MRLIQKGGRLSIQPITKEEFEKMIPSKFISPNDFMEEILKEYALEEATHFNSSLKYFVVKHSLIQLN